MSIDRIKSAERLLSEPLNQQFFAQTKDAIYDALERVNEQDLKALQSLAQMAKWRLKFMQFYQSFLETGKVLEFQERTKFRDRLNRFWPGKGNS